MVAKRKKLKKEVKMRTVNEFTYFLIGNYFIYLHLNILNETNILTDNAIQTNEQVINKLNALAA